MTSIVMAGGIRVCFPYARSFIHSLEHIWASFVVLQSIWFSLLCSVEIEVFWEKHSLPIFLTVSRIVY